MLPSIGRASKCSSLSQMTVKLIVGASCNLTVPISPMPTKYLHSSFSFFNKSLAFSLVDHLHVLSSANASSDGYQIFSLDATRMPSTNVSPSTFVSFRLYGPGPEIC